MLDYQSVRTYRDLLQALQKATDEQLEMPIQCADSHPVDEHVHTLKQAICLGTVDELEMRYARSVKDNRRIGDELVLFCDGNPFAEDGATGYVMNDAPEPCESAIPLDTYDRLRAVYPADHDESRDWTGPAQKLYDQRPRESGRGTLTEVLAYRSRSAGNN
jgi:hypothetical protein